MIDHHRESFASHIGAGMVALAVSALLSFILHGASWMHLYEEHNFDAWAIGAGGSRGDVFLVVVDDTSFVEDFGVSSPLNQTKMQELVQRVHDAGAGVIGVDVDTRDWEPSILASLPAAVREKVVWARLGFGKARSQRSDRKRNYDQLSALQPCAGSVVFGNSDVAHADRANITGIVRTMPRPQPIDGRVFAPLADVVAQLSKGDAQACREPHHADAHDGEYIRFLGRGASGTPNVPTISAHSLFFGTAADFRGGIVLIGTTFEESGDVAYTPFGQESGLFLHADVLNTRLEGSAYRPWSGVEYLLLEVPVGAAIILLGWVTQRRRFLFWGALFGATVASVLGSMAVFHATGHYVSFWPVLFGVGLHEVLERASPRYWAGIWADWTAIAGTIQRRFNVAARRSGSVSSSSNKSHAGTDHDVL